jgi:mono/diheme cytochrome c family protein
MLEGCIPDCCMIRIALMPDLRTLLALGTVALAATACQPLPASDSSAAPGEHPDRALAQSACGGCHAVDRRSVSPSPGAPPLAVLVNRPGLTRNVLAVWLRNAHNYPAEMDFTLEPRDAERIAGYMLTLREPAPGRGP